MLYLLLLYLSIYLHLSTFHTLGKRRINNEKNIKNRYIYLRMSKTLIYWQGIIGIPGKGPHYMEKMGVFLTCEMRKGVNLQGCKLVHILSYYLFTNN